MRIDKGFTMETGNADVRPLVAWGVVVGAISAAAGIFNAVDEAIASRAIRQSLREIKDYLVNLDQKLDQIEAQNREILRKLDKLPEKIRLIVQEIVEIALLNERYAKLKDIELNILELGQRRRYRLNRHGWTELSGALTYLFLFENRLSQMFRLIAGCELALVATRNKARPIVVNWINEKVKLIEALRADLGDIIDEELSVLTNLLNSTKFIKSHNLSPNLPDFSQLNYEEQPNRTRTVNYTERVCRYFEDRCGERYEVCRDEPRSRQAPDTPFHNARDRHIAKVEAKRKEIASLLSRLGELVAVIKRFEQYLATVESFSVTDDVTVMFYHVTFPDDSFQTADVGAMSEEMLASYGEYFDDLDALKPDSEFTDILETEETRYFSVIRTRCVV